MKADQHTLKSTREVTDVFEIHSHWIFAGSRMIPRAGFSEDHDIYRESVRRFIQTEIVPFHTVWEKEGQVSRDVWRKAGSAGFLCSHVPAEYGGAGADFRYNAIFTEELARAGATGPGFAVHSDMAAAYLMNFGSERQKHDWMPKLVSGEAIAAIALSEPGAGSDLKSIQTRAVRVGDDYIVNGQKTYISNGQLCDVVMLACKTDPTAGTKGISFLIVEANRPGFNRGRKLDKIGLKAQDTSELFFSDVRVPVTNLIGGEGQGFAIAMQNLAEERLSIAISAIGACEGILDITIAYVKEREVFGKPVASFQNTRFKLAELSAATQVARVFIDRCIELAVCKQLDSTVTAMAKMMAGELQCRVADECLQFFGGNGYMSEYPISRFYIDSRIRKIAGGSSEVMREIISRKLLS